MGLAVDVKGQTLVHVDQLGGELAVRGGHCHSFPDWQSLLARGINLYISHISAGALPNLIHQGTG